MLSVTAFADTVPSVEVSSVTVAEGNNAEVEISINNNSGISALYLRVDFEYPLELVEVKDAGLFGNPLFSEKNSYGYCILSWDESLKNEDNKKDGTVAKLKFFVPENTPEGEYDITVSYDKEEIYDKQFNNVSFEVKNGKITVNNHKFKEYKNTLLLNEKYTVEKLLSEKADIVEIRSDGNKLSAADELRSGNEIIFSDGRKITAVYLGDINADGKISAQDARIALRSSVELEELNEWQLVAANTDFEKTVTAKDARKILRASVELEYSSDWFSSLSSSMITELTSLYSVSSLSDDGTVLGEFIKKSVENFESVIDLSSFNADINSMQSIIEEYIYYVPSFFYVDKVLLGHVGNKVTGLQIEYENDAQGKFKEYSSMLNEIVSLCDRTLPETEIALFYHDYICENFNYDDTASVFDAYTMLKKKTGVCQAYSLLYTDILNKFGIDSFYVRSDALNHGWNLVEIGGKWYHVDVTWDDPTNDRLGRVRHEYFLLSDEGITSHKHKLWEVIGADIKCTSTKYDNAFWRSVDTSFVKNGSLWYYIGEYSDHYAIFETSLSNEGRMIYELYDKWLMSGSFYWKGYYSGLSVLNGRLIYNTSDSIMAYSIHNGSNITLYKSNDNKSIYGFTLKGDVATCNFNTSPDEKMTDIREIRIIITGDVNSDGLFNAKDYSVLIRYVNNLMSAINTSAADYNGDGSITEQDAKDLRYFIVNR